MSGIAVSKLSILLTTLGIATISPILKTRNRGTGTGLQSLPRVTHRRGRVDSTPGNPVPQPGCLVTLLSQSSFARDHSIYK